MAGLFGNILSKVQQAVGSAMQRVGQFEVVEIPANQLNSNTIYLRCLDDRLIASTKDVVYILKNLKLNEFNIVIRHHMGQNVKIFSVYRDVNEAEGVNVANRFRILSDLIGLAEDDKKLKALIQCIHSHPNWDGVHYAAATGMANFFTLLLDHRDVNRVHAICPSTGETPLHIAVQHNQLDLVEYLLSLGVDVKTVDLKGMNAFHYAASASAPIIKALSSHSNTGMAVNAMNLNGFTPLYIAVVLGKADCVSALVAAGAKGNIRCENRTILEAALASNYAQKTLCIELIAKAFPDLVTEHRSDGSTPLHHPGDPKMDPKIMKTLVQAIGNNPGIFGVRDSLGETPLHSAVRRADLIAVVSLISHGSNIDDRNPDGQTPLHLALSLVNDAGQLLILKALLVFGASTTITDGQGRLPRHIACTVAGPLKEKIAHLFKVINATRCPRDQKGCVDGCRYTENEQADIPANSGGGLSDMWQQFCVHALQEKKQNRSARLLNVLAMDGGGVKGVILIQTLLAMEKLIGPGERLLDRFHWVAGTSTGAIVAASFCQGKSLREVQRLYFRLKDTVMDTPLRPYNSSVLERFLKQELGETTTIGSITKPNLLVTVVKADINPVKLVLLRNYYLPLSVEENTALGYEDTRAWPLWKAVRCSSAAPTYFDSVDNQYVDGGLIANNPTLDLLTEVANYNFTVKMSKNGIEAAEIGCVVSLGCGEMPVMPIKCTMDVRRPSGLIDAVGAMFTMKNWGQVMIDQATATDGRPVDRSRAWCHSMNIPFFRFSPPLFKDVPLDTTDDSTLIQTLWCAVEHLHERQADLRTLAELLA